jgi:hypothetical protein
MISIKSIAFIDDQLASGEVPVRPEDAAFTQQPTTAGADRPGPSLQREQPEHLSRG